MSIDLETVRVGGYALVTLLGLLTLLLLLSTAYVGMRVLDPKSHMPLRYHIWIVRLTVAIALVHAALALQ
jgi:hypothetical protein